MRHNIRYTEKKKKGVTNNEHTKSARYTLINRKNTS